MDKSVTDGICVDFCALINVLYLFFVRNKWNLFYDLIVLSRTQNQTKLSMVFLVGILQFKFFFLIVKVIATIIIEII